MDAKITPPLMRIDGTGNGVQYFTDIQYNTLAKNLSRIQTYADRKLHIYTGKMNEVSSLVNEICSTVPIRSKARKKYLMLLYNTKQDRQMAFDELNDIKTNGPIVSYRNKTTGVTQSGVDVYLTEAKNYSGEVDASTGLVKSNDTSMSNDDKSSGNTLLYVVLGIIAITLIAGVIILIKKRS